MEERQYRVIETLGEGGFGAVFRAELLAEGGFTKQVALKVLHTDRGLPDEVALRLRDEARMLGHVRHRAVVGVDGLAHLDEGWAVVMEFVDGVDVRGLLVDGPTPTKVALEIVEEAASALHAAYYARPLGSEAPLKLVHRDIKPANLRLTSTGEVKVLDFGVARADFGSREAHTNAITYGTLTYMSPERLEGDDGPEGDIYALGLVLLDLLIGEERKDPPPRVAAKQRAYLNACYQHWKGILERQEPGVGEAERLAITQLLDEMLDFEEQKRPTARDVERRCRTLRGQLPGVWLRDWAEDHVPRLKAMLKPETDAHTGRLLRARSDSVAWDGHTPAHGAKAEPVVQTAETISFESLEEVPSPPPPTSAPVPPVAPALPAALDSTPLSAPPRDPPSVPARALALGAAAAVALAVVGFLVFRGGPETPVAPTPPETPALVAPTPPARPPPEVVAPVTPPVTPPAVVTPPVEATPAPTTTVASTPKTAKTPATAKTTPTAAAAADTGRVNVKGDAIRVRLVGNGKSYAPGEVPAGTYSVEATFQGSEPTPAGSVTVGKGETHTLTCSDTFLKCVER